MKDSEKILKSFSVKSTLNPKIWSNHTDPQKAKLDEKIRYKLLEIANKFQEFIGLDVVISDVQMTGSLANYNWSEYSDIDLHLIVDFTQFSKKQKELFTELFKLKKTLFNLQHNIKIYNYDVELYIQDSSEEHTSSGIYSVLNDEWIVIPKKEEFKVDTNLLKKKVTSWITKIDETIEQAQEEKDLEKSLEFLDKLKTKIKEYRKIGLSKEGEFSYENLVFKYLRRNGYIEKLFNFQNNEIDKRLSMEQNKRIKNLLSEASFSFDPSGNYSDATFGLPQGSVDSGRAAAGGENGNWGGSMTRALAFAKVANDFMGKNIITSQKRSRKLTASGNVSDHYEGNSASYAVDLACRGEQGDRLLAHLMDWFGHPEYTGNRWFNITKGGYRYQIGWRVPNHYDHIHVGVRKVGGADTPSSPKDKKSFKEKLLAFFGIDKDKSESEVISTEKQKKVDDPKKADILSTSVDDLYSTLDSVDTVLTQQDRGKTSYQKQVEAVQVALIMLGYNLPKFGVDGLFGSETANAIRKYKTDKNIKESIKRILRSVINENQPQRLLNTEADKKSISKETITPELVKQLISDLKSKGIESEDLKKLVDIPQLGITSSDDEFYKAILTGIGAPITDENMKFLYAWRQAEGGSATNNPFNTTYKLSKDENMSNYNSVGVKNYSTKSYGLEATIKTLKLSYYTCIVDGLKNDIGADKISKCSDLQKWGTGELVAKVVNSYNQGAAVKPKPILSA